MGTGKHKNFGGKLNFPIRSTFIKYPVFSPKFTFDDEGNMIAAKGFLVDMLYLIKDQLNFTASLSITVDGKFGGKTKDQEVFLSFLT